MKKISLIALALLLTVTAAVAQSPCDKKVVYHSDKQEVVNTSGEVVENSSESIQIEISKETISLMKEGNPKFTATVKEFTCDWKKAYEEGKAVYKATFTKNNGDSSEGSVTVEATGGKITIVFEIAAMEGKKARAAVSKYEEK